MALGEKASVDYFPAFLLVSKGSVPGHFFVTLGAIFSSNKIQTNVSSKNKNNS